MLRISAVMISVVLILGLYACSGAGRQEAQPQSPAPEAQQPASQQPAEAPAKAEPAPAQAEASKPAPRPAQAPPKAAPVQPPSAPAAATGSGAGTKPAASVPVTPPPVTEAAAAPATPPPPKTMSIPSGTRLEIRLLGPIDSSKSTSGDAFKATLDTDLEVEGKVVVPRGSAVVGKVTDVKQPGRVEGRAALSMTLTEIKVGNESYPIKTNTLAFEADPSTKQDATKIGIGAAAGAIIGAIAGGGKGAAIGAAVGGGAGTATVLATKGKDVKFGAEDKFSFVLGSDLGIKK